MFFKSIAPDIFITFIFCSSLSFAAQTPQTADLSFDEALEEMTNRHAWVSAQKVEVNYSEAKLVKNKRNFLPTLSATGSSGLSNSVGATASVNLFHGGADIAAVAGAAFDRDSQKQVLADYTLQAETESAETLVTAISKRMQVEALKRTVQTYLDGYNIAKQRYQKSLLPLQEVDKMTIDLDNAQAKVRDAEIEANTAVANLKRLLGHDHICYQWPWMQRLLSPKIANLIKSEIPLNSRPDYKAAAAQLNAEHSKVKQYYRSIFPSVDLSVYEGSTQILGQSFSNLSGSITLTIPLFNGLRDLSDYNLQIGYEAGAEVKLRQLEKDIKALGEASQKNMEIAIQTAIAREKTLEISQRLFKANELRLRQGRASANDLALDQNRLIDSELLAYQGWANAHLAFVKLCHTFGRRAQSCD